LYFCSNYGVKNEQIGDSHPPDYTGGEQDKFEDALRLLARMIAKDLLRKQSVGRQNSTPQTKEEN
jgi:hypothetical protein